MNFPDFKLNQYIISPPFVPVYQVKVLKDYWLNTSRQLGILIENQ